MMIKDDMLGNMHSCKITQIYTSGIKDDIPGNYIGDININIKSFGRNKIEAMGELKKCKNSIIRLLTIK